MSRDDEIDALLQRWVAWQSGRGRTSAGGYINGAYDPNRVPQTADVRAAQGQWLSTSDRQMVRVMQAVVDLPEPLRDAVLTTYGRARPLDAVAAALGITRKTLHNRLCHAGARIRQQVMR